MDSLVLVDTMGGAHPGAIRYFVGKVKERFSQPLEAHFHNDFGLAVANTLESLAAGVDVAHATVGGMSERGLLGHGAGRLVLELSRRLGQTVREAGLALLDGRHWEDLVQ